MKKLTFTVISTVLIFAAIAILSSTFVAADVIHVPQDQATIQAGINASANGDTVLVADNTYYENINFKGKAITVASHFIVDGDTSHINNTIIDGSQAANPDSGSTVYFVSAEDTNSVLTGFTITGGKGTRVIGDAFKDIDGGGIFIRDSGAKIENNKIKNNHLEAEGDFYAGGAGIMGNSKIRNLIIRGNEISNNTATTTGNAQAFAAAAIVTTAATCIIESNHIQNNVLSTPPSSFAFAAGLMVDGWDHQTGTYIVRNNSIRNNRFDPEDCGSGGGMVIQNCSPFVYNNIISENSGKMGGGIWVVHYDFSADAVGPKPRIFNNTIINNRGVGPGGGGILVGSSSESYAYLMNNIVWGNSGENAPQIGRYGGAGIKARYCVVQGDYSGLRNIDVDPMLVADSLADHSPAIGAGIAEHDFSGGVVLQCPPFDINGRERPCEPNSKPDIGAWESKLSSPLTGIDVARIAEIPERFTLYQNHPNPFNPSTTIKFDISKKQFITLEIHNLLGETIKTLVSEKLGEGSHTYTWNAKDQPSGVYFYQLRGDQFAQTRKMLLVR